MLRSRAKNVSFKTVRELDAFPKVPDSYVETTPLGGTFSVVTGVLVLLLMYAEVSYYLDSRFVFKFLPDTDYRAKLKVNIDLTVAMPCGSIGADILDSTNQNVLQFGRLHQEETWFELSAEQRAHFDGVRHVNSYLREEFHAIQELLWKSGQNTLFGEMPKRTAVPSHEPDACRVYGTLTLNKVAGNFHITAGRSLALPRGHIHISAFVSEHEYNFTHRVQRFSFGDPSPGIVHPLEGDEKVTDENMMLFQYFVEVVPTEVDTFLQRLTTYQYSVKDHQRPIDHRKGSHGVPGIFFKYDVSALKVRVTQQRDSLPQFLVRLCATVGGIYVTSGIINSMCQLLLDLLVCKYVRSRGGAAGEKTLDVSAKGPAVPAVSLVAPDLIPTNFSPVHLDGVPA
ncbi:endoplasmic reticulum-Golgi intermediate compartment protein 2 [Bacillus rossius redtenbacheri]|uniref:endoplasmic reticulum-Golgi intermediate compartment protein 2 n=1 Tax=Bacillus rossius redtenbacheri TaxID=93214 RepID=UPI002FDDB78A